MVVCGSRVASKSEPDTGENAGSIRRSYKMKSFEKILVLMVMSSALIGCVCLVYADRLSDVPPQKPEPKTVFRIIVESGLDEKQSPSTYTPQEQQAVNELKAVLSRWPKLMWLASVNGRLVLVKMGMDGKPVSEAKGDE
jgi:hypothetical protein